MNPFEVLAAVTRAYFDELDPDAPARSRMWPRSLVLPATVFDFDYEA
jgi:hypothetical protein